MGEPLMDLDGIVAFEQPFRSPAPLTHQNGPGTYCLLLRKPLQTPEYTATMQPVPVPNLEEDAAKYKPHIYIPEWKEIVAAVPKDAVVQIPDFSFVPMSSYHVQAVRRNHAVAISTLSYPASICGIIHTSDDHIMFGVRGGKAWSEMLCLAPAGAINPSPDNIITASFIGETRDELGLMAEMYSNPELLGFFCDKGEIAFVLYSKTTMSSKELIDTHAQAFAVYQNHKTKYGDEMAARKALAQAGHPNIDAWEHVALIGVPNTSKDLVKVMDEGFYPVNGKDYPLVPFAQKAIIVYTTSGAQARSSQL